MKPTIDKLQENLPVIEALLDVCDQDFIKWRSNPEKWNLLDIICHLYDEEREDFRLRTKWVLENPGELPPMFNPLNWVEEHNYAQQDFIAMVSKWKEERQSSIKWLYSLKNPKWDNNYIHPKLGKLTAKHYLTNWLAHDYLHIRQIIKLKFDYLQHKSNEDLQYAGTW